MLAAATLVSLPSCKEQGSGSRAAAVAEARPSATPEQRAETFGAMALLPQNISDFLYIRDLGEHLRRLAKSGLLKSYTMEDVKPETLGVESVVYASNSSEVNPATYALLEKMMQGYLPFALSDLGSRKKDAGEQKEKKRGLMSGLLFAEGLSSMGLKLDSETLNADTDWQNAHIPTLFAVYTFKTGHENLAEEAYDDLLSSIQEEKAAHIELVSDLNGFSGIRVDMAKKLEGEKPQNAVDQLIHDTLAKHSYYMLVRREGAAVICSICEDPAELRLPQTLEESALASDLLKECDPLIGKDLIAAAHLSKELSTLLCKLSTPLGSLTTLAPSAAQYFTKRGEADAANKISYDRAAEAINYLQELLQPFNRTLHHPTTLQLWNDEHLHLRFTCDSRGRNYQQGSLRLASLATAPNTALYMERTPMVSDAAPLDANKLFDSLAALGRGLALTCENEKRKKDIQKYTMGAMYFKPFILEFAAASKGICDGLDGHMAMVVDTAPAPTATAEQAATPADEAAPALQSPRFSLYAGVADRQQLSTGWARMIALGDQIASIFTDSPNKISSTPIETNQTETATHYKVDPASHEPDSTPSLTLTNSALAFGFSEAFNNQVITEATGSEPFAGCIFSLRAAPLKAIQAQKAAQKKQAAGETAALPDSLEEAKQLGEEKSRAFMEKLEEVYALSTTEDGVHTISIEVKMED